MKIVHGSVSELDSMERRGRRDTINPDEINVTIEMMTYALKAYDPDGSKAAALSKKYLPKN